VLVRVRIKVSARLVSQLVRMSHYLSISAKYLITTITITLQFSTSVQLMY